MDACDNNLDRLDTRTQTAIEECVACNADYVGEACNDIQNSENICEMRCDSEALRSETARVFFKATVRDMEANFDAQNGNEVCR